MNDATANGRAARWPPEVELLLCCARAGVCAARAERVHALVAGELNWTYLLQLAGRHGLQPLLYWQLNALCADAVPAAHLQVLRTSFQRVSALNIFLTSELQRLLALFAAQGIEAMPYKGPALAAEIYGNIALRQFSDLDILVRPADVRAARDILLTEDYAPLPALNDAQQAVLLRTQCNLPFTRERKRLVVELHWAVSARHFAWPFEPDDFWARSSTGMLAGSEIKRPATEDLLLALCVHGSKHLWERLAWVCDIAGLIEAQPNVHWAALLARARSTGSERMLLLGLRLAAELLGAKLPREVEQALATDPVVIELTTAIVADLFTPALTPSGLGGYFRFQLKARRRLRDKINYLRFIVTPTEEDLVQLTLPASFNFIYYLLRPLRMIMTGGPGHFH